MEKKLLIVDGTSILAEAHYKSLTEETKRVQASLESGKSVSREEQVKAFRTLLQSKEGTIINGVQGFFKVLFNTIDTINPTHLIVTWGAQRENNFRRKIYSGYKNDGTTKSPLALKEESLTKSLLKGMGIFQLESKTLEALDLAGLLITKFKKDFEIEVLARNTLSLQFTDEATVWFRTPSYKDIERRFKLDCSNFPSGSIKFDKDFLQKYKNLNPEQIPDYRALIGNSFSKIPGVKSVGEVTTLALLEEYESIENLYNDIDSCSSHDELVDFGQQLTKHLMLPFNPMDYLVKGRDEAFLGKELATYKRDEESALKINADESEFVLTNVRKTDIIKQLKSVCLAPITCNITKGLSALIESLEYSSLLVRYNPELFNPSSDVFVGEITDFNTLDDVKFDAVPSDDIRELVFIQDESIKSFGPKLKFDLSKSEYYSEDSINNRLEEKVLKLMEETMDEEHEKIVKEHCLKISSKLANDLDSLPLSQNIPERISGIQIENGCAYDLTDGLELNVDEEVEEFEEPVTENLTAASQVLVTKPKKGVGYTIPETNCGEDETNDATILAIDKPLTGFRRDFINLHDAIVDSPSRTTIILDDSQSTDEVAENNVSANQSNSKPKSMAPTLNLLEQLVINRYICIQCGEEFALVNSTATHCVHCGANSIVK